MSDPLRLPPLRSIRLYGRIARVALVHGRNGIELALASIANVRDAIAQLEEQHVRHEEDE
jgi:hypothetical protein